ncbi:hypothetical protein [Streptomyces sp. NPDC056169]|uniref:hypothetical protein n=1 Tax=Streptomyces sp. NPDC056169 TaxID=3345734 RepID=UPI0035DC8B9C
MTDETVRTPYARKIRYGVTGAPILPSQNPHTGDMAVRPSLVELVYSAARDGRTARVSASVTGLCMRDGKPVQPEGQVALHYKNGPDGWPAWLANEARLHAAAPPVTDPEPRVPLAEHTQQTLDELYDRVQEADAYYAEAQHVAQAMYRAWNEQRTALTEGATVAAGVHNTLLVLRIRLANSSRDWAQNSDDAWMYAVLYGWDCEQQHDHTPTCPKLLNEVATKHGWTPDRVERIRKHRAVFAKVGPNGETDAAARRAVDNEED